MIRKEKISEILWMGEEFWKEVEKELGKKVVGDSDNGGKREGKGMMCDGEMMSIVICLEFNC